MDPQILIGCRFVVYLELTEEPAFEVGKCRDLVSSAQFRIHWELTRRPYSRHMFYICSQCRI